MKITHISLNSLVTDYWSYQDNLLPKYHKKNGHQVSLITSKFIYDSKGEIVIDERDVYINENGIKVIRLKTKNGKHFSNKFRTHINLFKQLKLEDPEILFIHSTQSVDIRTIVKYIKSKPSIKVFIDNHADFSNSATNWFSKNILHKIIWRYFSNLIEPYTTKFYGVLPSRVDFLKNIYKIKSEKIELLQMGADDDVVNLINDENILSLREKYNIQPDDFLIVTGGKIDNAKKQVFLLMEAVRRINYKRLKLIVFGSIAEELRIEFDKYIDNNIIHYAGWADTKQSYCYFAAANLVVFPGRHSVYWEQTVALGIPMIVKYWSGTTHVDIGGNCKFLYDDSVEEIQGLIECILKNNLENYKFMKNIAISSKRLDFYYSRISNRSIEGN